jgi:hypothetical protein
MAARKVAARTRSRQSNAAVQTLDAILRRFNTALALVETAHAALREVEVDPDVGAHVFTLEFAIRLLRRVHSKLDRAIQLVHPERGQGA